MWYDNTMKKAEKLKVRRNIKDSVFTDLFRDKKYTLQLYKALHPEDKSATTKDIKIVTLKAIVVNDIYNDLGMIIKDKIIFLLESQSTWSVNILVRMFLYLANTYKNYLTKNKINLYGNKKVKLPVPELYVIYVGKDKIKNKTISLNKEYFNNKSPIDLKIKVITETGKNNIVGEYIDGILANGLMSLIFGFAYGYIMHLFADMFNGKGIPLFWPLMRGKVHIMDIDSSGWQAWTFCIVFLAIAGFIIFSSNI